MASSMLPYGEIKNGIRLAKRQVIKINRDIDSWPNATRKSSNDETSIVKISRAKAAAELQSIKCRTWNNTLHIHAIVRNWLSCKLFKHRNAYEYSVTIAGFIPFLFLSLLYPPWLMEADCLTRTVFSWVCFLLVERTKNVYYLSWLRTNG